MNVFRPVDDSTVLPDRIIQGQPWRNISFGKNAAIKSYQDRGLYLEVGSKPVHDQYSEAVVTAETIDHTTKTLVLTWEVQPLSAERIAEIQRGEAIEAEQVGGGLRGITVGRAKRIINDRYQAVRDLPVAGSTNAQTIANIEAKLDALIDACAWIDQQEAVYILK